MVVCDVSTLSNRDIKRIINQWKRQRAVPDTGEITSLPDKGLPNHLILPKEWFLSLSTPPGRKPKSTSDETEPLPTVYDNYSLGPKLPSKRRSRRNMMSAASHLLPSTASSSNQRRKREILREVQWRASRFGPVDKVVHSHNEINLTAASTTLNLSCLLVSGASRKDPGYAGRWRYAEAYPM